MSEVAIIEQRRKHHRGFDFGRVLPSDGRRMIGPFIFFDHMGPSSIGSELDIHPHPHIGLAAITYLFDGQIIHRDSVGSEQVIQPGEANWMTAGRGITHSERFPAPLVDGQRLHCLQAWVALPTEDEETDPFFAHYRSDALPTAVDERVWRRVIVGEMQGLKSPVKTHSPVLLVHLSLESGALAAIPQGYSEIGVYIVSGSVEVNGTVHSARRMLAFSSRGGMSMRAVEPTVLMVIGGEPVGDRYVEWNFVSTSRERIAQAKSDWREKRMKLPDFDSDHFIPLPQEPMASALPD